MFLAAHTQVSIVLLQKNGAGLVTAASCLFDTDTDGTRTVRWENATMCCICSVFGLTL